MELAEVQAAFPEMECLLFMPQDEAEVYKLLERLRDLFGKDAIRPEDALRRDSLRRTQEFRETDGVVADSFLQDAQAELNLAFAKEPIDPRALELLNKTNQFNLNGRRYTEGSWLNYLKAADTVLLVASYKDKFGPLGKIAVLSGRRRGSTLAIESWVMSCRAFSRRIEYRCLEALFERFGVEWVEFAFEATPRNGPTQEFLATLLGRTPESGVLLSRSQFRARCPALYHKVQVVTDG